MSVQTPSLPRPASAPPAGPAGRRTAPGPRGHWLLGSLPDVQRLGPLQFFLETHREHGDVVRYRFGPQVGHLLVQPEHVQHVLQRNSTNYSKDTRGFRKLRLVLGNGLLTSDGEFWLRQRRIAQPAFHRGRVAALGKAMTDAAEATLRRWQVLGDGAVVDVHDEMMRLTLAIVGETLLGTSVDGEADTIGRALEFGLREMNGRILRGALAPDWVPTAANRRFRGARRELQAVVDRIIESRRRSGAFGHDVLSLLMQARDPETGEAMDDRQLRDEVLTILLAGHETTANALAWTWYLLSEHPAWAERLQDELRSVLGGRAPTVADLGRLELTRRILEESLRLYPPAWILGRKARQDDTIGGFHIPAGSLVFLSQYVTHRHRELWPEPAIFDPDRFLPERVAERPRYAFFPFGGGPRQCIGKDFALLEATLILATLAQAVRPELVPGTSVRPLPLVTLRPAGGLPMRLHGGLAPR